LSWFLRRLLLMVPSFVGITLITFVIMHLAPGDPSLLALGEEGARAEVSREAILHFRETMGLNDSIPVQYGRWLVRVLHFDFGSSWTSGRAVTSLVAERLPTTLLISFLALFLSYAIAIPTGVHAAARRGAWSERLITFLVFALYSLPVPFAGIVLILYLGGGHYLSVLPVQGLHSETPGSLGGVAWFADTAWHLIAPVACLTCGAVAGLSRFMRTAVFDALREDYVRTARAKGLSERAVIWRHAVPNSLLPMVTLLGLYLPHLIGGSVIVERIFGIDGMGMLAFRAVLERDYDVVMGLTTLTALLTLGAMLVADLVYSLVDPRIRVE
jgi:peptide/nickel transport system permease protein